MKQLTITATLLLVMAFCQTKGQNQNSDHKIEMETKEKRAIENLLFSYRDALNASDVGKVLALYGARSIYAGKCTNIGWTGAGKRRL